MKIVVHHSASEFGSAIVIDSWHRERWGDRLRTANAPAIGYHGVIQNGFPHVTFFRENRRVKILDGAIEPGRPFDADEELEAWEAGAHAYGYNRETLAICLIGIDTFTRNQIISLVKLLKWWQHQFGVSAENIVGHRELSGARTRCPGALDMDVVRRMVMLKGESMKLLARFKAGT